MSTTIDERVVEMRFDNRHFENNVQTTLSSLEKLKSGLNLSGATKGLENIDKTSRNINMSGLTNAIETVNAKFSAMEVMAITALSNITNSAINAGKRIVSSLTIDPIKSGFEEYETQINAVQTILANTESKGKTIKDVNAALDELNTYADKTIYNFTEMTRNIGTFTAAGVDLDTSVAAIKGIANLAAVSGSTSQQASTAMYQLSQALAAGTVKLQDWNSVVNAGMGGQVFQDALMETARVHGVAIDKMIKEEGSFRETLQKGWLTSEVLTETLSKFTGDLNEQQLKTMGYSDEQIKSIIKMGQTANDAATKVKTFTQLFDTLKEAAQSGWTQSWEIIVGDFEEAKEMLTEVSDTFSALIGASAEARNSMLQGWKDLGGRTALIEACRNAFQGIVSVITPIKEAFREIFPPITSEQLMAFTEGLKNLTSHLKLSEEQSANLKSTFKGLFAILDIGKQAFLAIWNAVTPLIGSVTGFGDGILSVTGTFGDWLVKLDEMIKKSDVFNKALQKVSNVIQTGLGFASNIVNNLAIAFKTLSSYVSKKINLSGLTSMQGILDNLKVRMDQVSKIAEKFKMAIKNAFDSIGDSVKGNVLTDNLGNFINLFKGLWNVIKTIGNEIGKVFSTLGTSLANMFNNANFDQAFDLINGGLFAGLLLSLKNFVGGFGDALDNIGSITENVAETLDSVRGCFEAYQQNLQAKTLLTIASAIAILAGSILLISTIDSKQLTASLGAMTALFGELLISLNLFSKMNKLKGVTKTVTALIGIATAVLVLSGALKMISSIDTKDMATGLAGITGLTAVIVLATKELSKGRGKIMKGATSLVIFASAIKILASACKDLSQLSWDEMARGLTGVGVLMAEVSLFLNTAKFSKRATGTATGMLVLSAAIKVLASSCKDFAVMNWEEIKKGLTAIGGLLAELAIFTNLTGNAKHVLSTGTSMVLLGASMKIFASAVKDFSGMSWDEIARGLTGMAGALLAITVAVNLMPKNMVKKGVGLIAVSAALSSLSDSLNKMGGMSWEEIARGLTALGGSMAILAVGLNVMNGTLAGSAALVVAAAALGLMTPVLTTLGDMSWESIAKGLLALAGAFTVIGVAGLVLAPIVPVILSLAGSIALIGVGILGVGTGLMAAGAGLAALSTGLLALAGVTTATATAIVASLSIIIVGVAALIPSILEKVGEGIVAICGVIVDGAPAICEAVTVIISCIVDALVQNVPKILDGIGKLLVAVLDTIVKYGPNIIQSAINILLMILKGISDNIGKIISAAIDVVVAFINGVASKLPDVIQAGFDLIISFINGITQALNNNTDVLVEAISNLILAIVDAALAVLGGAVDLFIEAGKKIIVGLATGIKDKITDAIKAIQDLIVKIEDFFGVKFSDFKEIGGHLIDGFIQGVKDKFGEAVDTISQLSNDVVTTAKNIFGIHSPSKVFRNEVGKQVGAGMALGVKDSTKKVTNETSKMSKKAIETAKKEFDAFKSWVSDEKYFNRMSLEEELKAWEKAQTKYAKYSDLRKEADKEVYRLKKELVEESFNKSKEWMDDRKFYGQMTTKQELEAWERLQVKYKDNAEKRKEIDKEVYTLKKQLEEETFNNSKEWIDDQKFYEKMTLKQELAAWKRIQSKYKEGTEQRKEADKQVYTLEKQWNSELEDYESKRLSISKDFNEQRVKLEQEYADKVKEINDKLVSDIEAEQAKYDSAVKSRADSIYNSYSLFDAVDPGEEVDGNTLMTNLKGQVNALNSWRRNLNKIAGKGVSEEFISELEQMGPSASRQIEALSKMSSSQLTKYVGLWAQKHQIATNKATEELESLRTETNNKIEQLKSDAEIQLSEYRVAWNEQMTTLKQDTLSQLEEIKTNWVKTIGDISDIKVGIEAPVDDSQNAGKELMDSFAKGVTEQTSNVETNTKTVSTAALNVIKESSSEYEVAGSMIVDGFIKGINDNKPRILAAMVQLANDIINTMKETLGIHSPSKVMQSLGQFASLGFVNGLNDYSNQVYDASSNIGETATNGLSNAISKISEVLESDMDSQPTIRPVLDLSNIESGTKEINSMLSRNQAISISNGMNSKYSEQSQNGTNSSNGNSPVYQFTQNNYSPKALSRIDIYRQTKNQFAAMKGALV